MNGYDLSRKWFDFCYENPEKIKPNHAALYMFAIEHCNRLGWKEKFGFPTEMAKDAIGIKNYKTYINTLNDLVEWGFIKMIEKSKNQYSANIIAIVNYTKATTKALDKASIKHLQKQDTKQCQSTYKSIDSIIKHITLNIKHVTVEQITALKKIIIEKEKGENQDKNSNLIIESASQLKKLLDQISEQQLQQMKELTLYSGNFEELKQKFCVEFIGRYGLNKTFKQALESLQSWMHKDKGFVKEKSFAKKEIKSHINHDTDY